MKEKISQILRFLQSFLFKSKCVCCKKHSNQSICEDCLKQITYNGAEPVRFYEGVPFYSATKYTGNIRKALLGLKFETKTDVTHILARILFDYWQTLSFSKNNFEIIPVPIHKKKIRQRGFDQAKLIAQEFSSLSNNRFNASYLIRSKETLPQFRLSQEERKANLKNAFTVNKKCAPQLTILLFDDICTTGATLYEAIKLLKDEGLTNIYVLTLCDVDLKKQSINIR